MAEWVNVIEKDGSGLDIVSFGIEEDGHRAKWGPGIRQFYILHFVISGKGYFNGRPVHMGEGFLICPNQLTEYHGDEANPWQYFFTIFSGIGAMAVLESHGISEHSPFFRFSFRNEFPDAYRQFIYAGAKTAPLQFGQGVLYMLLSSVVREQPHTQESKGQYYVRAAREYIASNYHQRIRMSDVAHMLFIDVGYMYNLFIKYTGISPKEYLNQIRCSHACRLLAETNLQISEVSRSVGYEDPLQFSKFFKMRCGMSPLAYRHNLAEQNRQNI